MCRAASACLCCNRDPLPVFRHDALLPGAHCLQAIEAETAALEAKERKAQGGAQDKAPAPKAESVLLAEAKNIWGQLTALAAMLGAPVAE